MEKTELIILVVIALAIFAGVFYFLQRKPSNETWVENSLLVKSSDPLSDIQNRLTAHKIFVEQHLFASNDSRNSYVAIMSSEISRALALRGKNVSVYAVVQGGKNVCGASNCTNSSIVVEIGACNCVYFNPSQIIVEGDEKFLNDQSVRVGRLAGFALYKKTS